MSIRPTIMKFGGTSVEDARAFAAVAEIVNSQRGLCPVVVVSAMSRVTDALLSSVRTAAEGRTQAALLELDEHFERHAQVAQQMLTAEEREDVLATLARARHEIASLSREVSAPAGDTRARLRDEIVSYGERLSATLLACVLRSQGLPARYVDARNLIITDDEHGCAAPLIEQTE